MPIFYLFLALLAGFLVLYALFPESMQQPDDWMRFVYLSILLLFIGGGLRMNRIANRDALRHAGLWLAIILGLVLAYELLKRFT